MTTKAIQVRQSGGSISVTIPKEIADRVGLAPGDKVIVTGDSESIHIRRQDPEFERIWKLYEAGVRKYQNALRELAK